MGLPFRKVPHVVLINPHVILSAAKNLFLCRFEGHTRSFFRTEILHFVQDDIIGLSFRKVLHVVPNHIHVILSAAKNLFFAIPNPVSATPLLLLTHPGGENPSRICNFAGCDGK